MLIALLISLLFGTGGPEAMFAIPDMETRIPATISDLEKQAEVQFIFTRTNNDIASYTKKIAAQGADLKRLQSERINTSSQLQASFEEVYLIRQELQFLIVDRDAEVRAALTDEEFAALITEGLRASAPDAETAAYNAQGWGQQLDQHLEDIRTAIKDNIADPDKRADGLAAFEEFDTYMKTLVKQDPNTAKRIDIYSKREIPRTVLEDTYTDMDRYRSEMFDRFIDMREVLVEVTTEKEWTPIANKLNVMFK